MRRFTITALAVAAALALAGCSAGSASIAPDGGVDNGGVVTGESGGGVAPGADGVDGDTSKIDREVITTGYMSVTVDKPLTTAIDVVRITESVGGRVDSRTEYAPTKGDNGRAVLTLRLPASSLTATIDKLRALGTVQELNISTTDVTTQTQDLDARIRALSASVDRLVALLERASDTDVLIKLETAISDRQGQLESLESQRRYLTDQVSLSTLTLTLLSLEDTPVDSPDTFWSGLAAGWAAMVAFFSGVVVVTGVLIPWLVLLGIATLVTIVLIRRRAKRSRAASQAGVPADSVVVSESSEQ